MKQNQLVKYQISYNNVYNILINYKQQINNMKEG